jgi:hypothetical protein
VSSRENLEEITTMQARQELQRLTGRLPLLSLIANLAPLVGLLGTVVGMVKAFQQVANAQGPSIPVSWLVVFGKPSSPRWWGYWWRFRRSCFTMPSNNASNAMPWRLITTVQPSFAC